MERHQLWVSGPDGGVEQCEGPAIGVDLASILAVGLPPWRASFELLGALAEIFAVLEEDGEGHGRLDADVVFVDDTGCVSVEGFRDGVRDVRGADRLALGVLAITLCGGRFDPTLPRTPAQHDDARTDAVLSLALDGLSPGVEGDLQWLVARLLSADPANRLGPLQVWRACASLAANAPGDGLEAFGRSVVEGQPVFRARVEAAAALDPTRPSTAFLVAGDLSEALDGDAPPNTMDWVDLDGWSPRRATGHGVRRTELGKRETVLRKSLAPPPAPEPAPAPAPIRHNPTGDTEFILGAPEGRTFRFERCLGAGGFGEVYLCSMTSPGGVTAQVAVKVLRDGIDPRAQAVRRLKDEARVLGALNHPAVLTAHDLVVLDGRVAMVTEYVPGADLDVCLSHPTDPPPLRSVLEALAQAADALDACWNATDVDGHPVKLVHRDIKPSNLRIGTHGQVKVLDFGIATFDTLREAKTQVDQFIGTPAYMPPERITDMADLPAGDVYALAAVLYEALTGRSLWAGVSQRGQYRFAMERKDHDQRVEEHLAAITAPGVVSLLAPCLRHDPAQRPTAREMSDALEDLADRTPGLPLRRWAKAHPWGEDEALEGSLVGRTLSERMNRSDGGPRPTSARATHRRDEPPSEWTEEVTEPNPVAAATIGFDASMHGEEPTALMDTPAPAPRVVRFAPSDDEPWTAPPDTGPREDAPTSMLGARAEPAFDPGFDAVPEEDLGPVGPILGDDDLDDLELPPPRRGGLGLVLVLGGLLAAGVAMAATAAIGLVVVSLPGSGDPVAVQVPVPGGDPRPKVPDPVAPTEPQPGGVAPEPVPSGGPGPRPVPDGGQPGPAPDPQPVPGPGDPGPLASANHGLPLPVPGPVPGGAAAASSSCPPESLEAAAQAGRLSSGDTRCLAAAMRDTSARLVDRRKVGRVLLVDARTRCAEGSVCPDYEALQREFFEELDRSDPEMMAAWSRHLFVSAGSDVGRLRDAYVWAGLALERKSEWSGRTRTERLRSLNEIRAKSAQRVFALTSSEKDRELARDAAVEWAELLRGLALDASPAMELCAAVVGASSTCEKRVSTDAILVPVTFLSVPPRAIVFVDGREIGASPTTADLPHGSHEVRMRLGDTEGTHTIQVGASQPTRWQWSRDAQAWKPFTD